MEEADLACVSTEEADKTYKAQRDKARGYGRGRVERNGRVGTFYHNADFGRKRLLQRSR